MKIIRYFQSGQPEHWLGELQKCDWTAGCFLYELLSTGRFFAAVGDGSEVLLLTEGEELIAFCTYAKWDDIQPTELSPWMGFVYTFPRYRGHRYAGLLFREVERMARAQGVSQVYISTDHSGLYEKYGCSFLAMMPDRNGAPSRVYQKPIQLQPPAL